MRDDKVPISERARPVVAAFPPVPRPVEGELGAGPVDKGLRDVEEEAICLENCRGRLHHCHHPTRESAHLLANLAGIVLDVFFAILLELPLLLIHKRVFRVGGHGHSGHDVDSADKVCVAEP